MPPVLALTATLEGEPTEFIARDVPTGVFFAGFQDTFPGAECFARLSAREQHDNIMGHEAWVDQLLCRAMISHRLTLEVVQRLGSARDDLAVGYLWGIGYHVPAARERERLVRPRWCRRRRVLPDRRSGLIAVPSPNLSIALRLLSAFVATVRRRRHETSASAKSIDPQPDEALSALLDDDDYARLIEVPSPNIRLALREIAGKSRAAPHDIWRRWPISAFIWTWHSALRDDLKKRAARGIGAFPESDIVARVGRERS